MTVLSISSGKDLTKFNSDLVTFHNEFHESLDSKFLKYKNKWFITRKGDSCSCSFRNLERWNIQDIGFSEPQEWSPEDSDDIAATHEVFNVIYKILDEGERVDSVTSWEDGEDTKDNLTGNLKLNLSEIGIEKFRFFDDYRFDYYK